MQGSASPSALAVRAVTPADAGWIRQHVTDRWRAETIVAHGEVFRPHELPGFIALWDGEPVGLVTYRVDGDGCEIVTIDTTRPGSGIGTRLIETVKEVAEQARCRRLWLLTTNDNLHALGFYQKRGFSLVRVHVGAANVARRLKPSIPLIGFQGIPVRDDIELEMRLSEG
jgi:ribosomal protein S18 acetylase RimI-like enzyme